MKQQSKVVSKSKKRALLHNLTVTENMDDSYLLNYLFFSPMGK